MDVVVSAAVVSAAVVSAAVVRSCVVAAMVGPIVGAVPSLYITVMQCVALASLHVVA